MKKCNFEKLILYLDKQLELDEVLEVLNHLDCCSICRDAVYELSRDRDAGLYVSRSAKASGALAG